MAGGRPTKYDPKYCEMLIEHMAKGFSYESFAGIIHTCRKTLYVWELEHPEFLHSKKQGVEQNLVFWEKTGHEGLWDETHYDQDSGKPTYKKSLNTTLWIFQMKNRHRWADRHEVKSEVEATVKPQRSMKELKEEVKKALEEDE